MPPAGTPGGDELDQELKEVFGALVEEQGNPANEGKPVDEQTVDIPFETYVFHGIV